MIFINKDESLKGNEIITDGIKQMYENLTDENLACVLSAVRRRMNEKGHFVVAVTAGDANAFELRTVCTPDGKHWFAAFTDFEEELKKTESVVSGFTAEISGIFRTALASEGISGVILNPWDKALKIDRNMIRLIRGNNTTKE